jgi:hypothetical protein
MLFDEVRGDADGFLRTGFVPEYTERDAFPIARVEPIIGFETWRLTEEMYEDILDALIDLLAVLCIETIPPNHCVHGYLPSLIIMAARKAGNSSVAARLIRSGEPRTDAWTPRRGSSLD